MLFTVISNPSGGYGKFMKARFSTLFLARRTVWGRRWLARATFSTLWNRLYGRIIVYTKEAKYIHRSTSLKLVEANRRAEMVRQHGKTSRNGIFYRGFSTNCRRFLAEADYFSSSQLIPDHPKLQASWIVDYSNRKKKCSLYDSAYFFKTLLTGEIKRRKICFVKFFRLETLSHLDAPRYVSVI